MGGGTTNLPLGIRRTADAQLGERVSSMVQVTTTMDGNDLSSILMVLVTMFPNVIVLGILIAFLVRHFRVSLVLMTIAHFGWLCSGVYTQYLARSGASGGMDIWPIISGISTLLALLNIVGLALLLVEWSKLLQERGGMPQGQVMNRPPVQ